MRRLIYRHWNFQSRSFEVDQDRSTAVKCSGVQLLLSILKKIMFVWYKSRQMSHHRDSFFGKNLNCDADNGSPII